ncbi:Osmosensitive K+ channel histidine kinase KdpD [Sandaracinus amylolyticus]|uniref:histidine kinase n=1 Tax=Sandaracinus amylolyticus TaxID=927083 RepID=A0A0F6SFP2_9BACT|nr:Osmosensitive K+ channel histidine kinase KdpD [Sandaracinus amylolyticus]
MDTELSLADVARLEDVVDRAALAEVCRSFFELFSLPVRVFSRDGTLLSDVHEEQAICRYVNGFAPGRAACSALVGEVRALDPEGGPVEHPCFTGACYRVVPIHYQGRRLGRFVVGPYMPAERREVPRSLLVLDDRIDPRAARDALGEMPRVRQETIERITEHLRRVLDLILFSGHRAYLTSQMHVASVRESYRELTEKTQRLQEAYDRLKELDRLKSNFLATVSHELRTPLTSIIGYSDMLASGIAGELNGEQQEFVETIRSKGDHLLALITSLLDLNKLEQGNLPLRREPVAPSALIDDLAKTVLPQAQKKGVKVEVDVQGARDPMPLDPVRIKQVLFNLAENAIKFTPKGGSVRFGVRATEMVDGADDEGALGLVLMAAPRRAVEFWISDSGIGIPSSEHQKIFDAFYQVDGSSTREHGGTGLGLSIVKRLVDAHGGRVWVESKPGEGATFRVAIPEPDELA